MAKEITKDFGVIEYLPSFEGGCLQEEIDISYKELVAIFGQAGEGDGYKTECEWTIQTPSGRASIYDYKEGKTYCGSEGTNKTEIRNWHIGGSNHEVADWIIGAIKKHNG
jgi:hypothetical protein